MSNIEKRLALLEYTFTLLCDYLIVKTHPEISEEKIINVLLVWQADAKQLGAFNTNIFKEED